MHIKYFKNKDEFNTLCKFFIRNGIDRYGKKKAIIIFLLYFFETALKLENMEYNKNVILRFKGILRKMCIENKATNDNVMNLIKEYKIIRHTTSLLCKYGKPISGFKYICNSEVGITNIVLIIDKLLKIKREDYEQH